MPSFIGADGFRFHFITDIHVGHFHYHPTDVHELLVKDTALNLAKYLKYVKQCSVDDLPDLVVVGGDLTSFATEEEMSVIENKLKGLVDRLSDKRSAAPDKPPPCLALVPGNHDLDWSREDQAHHSAKIERFARLSGRLAESRSVISAVYPTDPTDPTSQRPVYHDYKEQNVFFYLFDSTAHGGRFDPKLTRLYQDLRRLHRSAESLSSAKSLKETAEKFFKLLRTDPGFILKDDLEKMEDLLREQSIPRTRIKIAVMHHNLSSVLTDDVEAYDAIVNAGAVKSVLVRTGFDFVLHGHRHVSQISEEQHDYPLHQAQRLVIVGGDSLGCREKAPFFEFRIKDPHKAHAGDPPTARYEIHKAELLAGGHQVDPSCLASGVVDRTLHGSLAKIMPKLGRHESFGPERDEVLGSLTKVMPYLQILQRELVDWGEKSEVWIQDFNDQLERFSHVYATDLSRRLSMDAPQFERYLRQQYRTRACSLRRTSERKLYFSRMVWGAIQRTQWKPDPCCWNQGWEMVPVDKMPEGQSELVRILIRTTSDHRDPQSLKNLDFDHATFAIPLFVYVLDPDQAQDSTLSDFALGIDHGNRVVSCYEFDAPSGEVHRSPGKGPNLLNRFLGLLSDPRLTTVGEFLGKPMVPEAQYNEFAERYQKWRTANADMLEKLENHIKPEQDKVGLEIGCGNGNYTIPFVGKFRKLYGLDSSSEMLEIAKSRSNEVTWILGDALQSGFPSEQFDAVWMISTLHYFRGEGRQKQLLREIYRILKPEGILVADTEFVEQNDSLWIVDYFPSLKERYLGRIFKTEQYEEWLKAAGFTVQFEYVDFDHQKGDTGLRIGQHRPELYLKESEDSTIPAFQQLRDDERKTGFDRLREDIGSGKVQGVMQRYKAEKPGDIGIIVAVRKAVSIST